MALDNMPRLGFGLMRLPVLSDGRVDIPLLESMVDTYMGAGFNYFDTAYVYHGGESERAVKKVLAARYERTRFLLATKLPAWFVKREEDRDRIFSEQLERCGVSYFDFYLLHGVEDGPHYDTYERFHCFEWGERLRDEGRIRHFGFSFHGSPALLERVLDEHPNVDFVQIQINYADWNNPLVCSGALYEILRRRSVPIFVMEPVKGGLLASLPPGTAAPFLEARPTLSLASWALRFVLSLEGVTTVLSGMSNPDQISDNINTARDFKPLTEEERGVIKSVVKKMQDIPLVSCTSCRYCTGGCPVSINIPDIFRCINTTRLYPTDRRPGKFYHTLIERGSGKASMCIKCRQCEQVCPQHLPVTDLLKEAVRDFEM